MMTDSTNLSAVILSILALIVSLVGVIVSYFVAKNYGDMAALKAGRKLQKEDARRARKTALQVLLNEVGRIRKVADRNSNLVFRGTSVARMPVAAFETAFVSGRTGLEVGTDLLQAVTDYLAYAESINSLIDFHLAGKADSCVKEVARLCGDDRSEDNLHSILERLESGLVQELRTSEMA